MLVFPVKCIKVWGNLPIYIIDDVWYVHIVVSTNILNKLRVFKPGSENKWIYIFPDTIDAAFHQYHEVI